MRPSSTLFAFILLLTTVSHSARANWDRPPSDQQQYSLHQLPIPHSDIQKIREAFRKNNPTHRPETRTIVAGGVRVGGGGGGGIACFNRAEDAELTVDSYTRRIRPGTEHLIQWLFTYDAVIFEDNLMISGRIRQDFILPKAGETSMTYLYRILDTHIKKAHPVLAEKLQQALIAVDPSKWLHNSPLPFMNDTGSNTQSHFIDKCNFPTYVQMVVRYERSNHGKLPFAVLDADYNLLNRMRMTNSPQGYVINEALLVLHEALYLMAVEMGHTTSVSIRRLAGDLLSPYLSPKKLAENLHLMFWNFDRFLSAPAAAGPATTAQQQSTAFPDVLRNADSQLHQYLQSLMPSRPTYETIWDLKNDSSKMSTITKWLLQADPSFSFLFQARYAGIRARPKATPDVNTIYVTPSKAYETFTFYCQSLEIDSERTQSSNDAFSRAFNTPRMAGPTANETAIIQRALQYCRTLGVAPMVGPEARSEFFRKYRQ